MIGRFLKQVTRNSQKRLPKKIFEKSLKNTKKKEKKNFLSKKGMSKKVLKRKTNKPYIVTHWHASLNYKKFGARKTLSE